MHEFAIQDIKIVKTNRNKKIMLLVVSILGHDSVLFILAVSAII